MKKMCLVFLLTLNFVLPIYLIANSIESTSVDNTDFDDREFSENSNFVISSPSVEEIFKAPWDQMFYYSSPAIDMDGNIYIGSCHKAHWGVQGGTWSEHYYMYSFEPGPDFDLRWQFDVGPNIVMGGPVIHPEGLIFFTTGSYNATTNQCPVNISLYALNSDGSLNWSYPIGIDIENSEFWWGLNSPALDNMGNVYVHGYNFYYSFHWNNGTVRWQKNSLGYPGSPSILNDTVYFSGKEISAYYVNGTSKWNYTSTGYDRKHRIAFGLDGTIYYASEKNNFTALHANGTLKWTLKLTELVLRANPVIDREGTIYIGTHNDTQSELFAIHPNGTIKWRNGDYFRDLYNSPAIGSDGNLYIAAEKHGDRYNYFVINKTNGDIIQLLTLKYDVTWSSSVINDGYVFIGDMGGYLYAIHEEGLELAHEPWPCMGGNPQRTGIGDDRRSPTITNIIHTPFNPTYEDEITLSADVVDGSEIQSVTCFYRVNDGTWFNKSMDRIQSDTYQASIGYYSNGDEIDYCVEAYDNSLYKNYHKNDNSSEFYKIIVGPETTTSTADPALPDISVYILLGSAVAVCCVIITLRSRKG